MVHQPVNALTATRSQHYGNPYGVDPFTAIIAGAGAAEGIVTAITSPFTSKQQRLAAEAAAQGQAAQAQAQTLVAQSQLQQAQYMEQAKTQRWLFGGGALLLLAVLGLGFFALRK